MSTIRFDTATDYSDHHYRNKPASVSPAVNKKIMQEWRILQDSLPDTIYVRAYENRVNLLRAAIQGAAGTPYHNGLFFFDIFFPENYPACPPKVHYHSFGFRINPNLYKNGTVCLSLLNTWPGGQKCEVWTPDVSTVSQVLLSIQALVLNEDPFYNEPKHFYSRSKGKLSVDKARWYNKDAYLLSLKTMRCVLSRQPKNFEGIIQKHFKERGVEILSECREFYKEVIARGETMTNFYGVLMDLVNVLKSVEALPVGFEIKVGRIKVVNKKRRTSGGFVKMCFGKLKKVFGLKQNLKAIA